ncbi:MAG TPA: hypothetical protein V6C97_01335 [Oculatellaceae cyanobacterium]
MKMATLLLVPPHKDRSLFLCLVHSRTARRSPAACALPAAGCCNDSHPTFIHDVCVCMYVCMYVFSNVGWHWKSTVSTLECSMRCCCHSTVSV